MSDGEWLAVRVLLSIMTALILSLATIMVVNVAA